MPATHFICPDGIGIPIESCLHQCRLEGGLWGKPKVSGRCMPVPMLRKISSQFKWDGIPHVTSCLNGTVMEYLKHKVDYPIVPDDRVFALIGLWSHKAIEDYTRRLAIEGAEMAVTIGTNQQGKLDWFDESTRTLWDYKVIGSYKVGKILGMKKRMIVDPSGAVYLRKGKYGRPGDPKMIAIWDAVPDEAELIDYSYQLNRYRQGVEQMLGVKVQAMKIMALVRDGGIAASTSRGIMRCSYVVNIPFIDDGKIQEYFTRKARALCHAIEHDEMPEIGCNDRECWGGRRCEGYCDVSEWCPYNRKPAGRMRRVGRGTI